MNRTQQFYAHPSYVGGNFPVYSGSRRQRGGSVFGSALRNILPDKSTVGKAVGQQLLGYVSDVARDVMQGQSIGDAMKERAKERAASALSKGVKQISHMAGQAIARKLKRPAPTPVSRPAKRRRVAPPAPPRRRRVMKRRPRVSMQKRMPRLRHRPRGRLF